MAENGKTAESGAESTRMSEQEWHLDKRVPISIIAVMVVQLVGFVSGGVWFASKMDSRIDAVDARVSVVDRDMNRLARQLSTMADASNVQAVQLGRIEEQITGMRGDVSRLISAIERRVP